MDGQNIKESILSQWHLFEGSGGYPTYVTKHAPSSYTTSTSTERYDGCQIEAIATILVPPVNLLSGEDVHMKDGSFD